MRRRASRSAARRSAGTFDLARPLRALPGCGPRHVRPFDHSRLRPIREARGLTLSGAATQARRHGDAGGQGALVERLDARVLGAIEDGAIDCSADVLLALASVYGVEPSAFTECVTCRDAASSSTGRARRVAVSA